MKASQILKLSEHVKPGTVAREEHFSAFMATTGHPAAIRYLLAGWARYAAAHKARFEATIGEDYVLGPEWEAIGRAILGLLNGETGGFDCGSLDGNIRTFAKENGVDLDTA